MIDLRRLYTGLTQIISIDEPDATILAAALDLDLSQARVVKAKSVTAIVGKKLKGDEISARCRAMPINLDARPNMPD